MSETIEHKDDALPIASVVSREEIQRTLRHRAETLARPLRGGELEETSEYVIVDFDQSAYAIQADSVREVLAVKEVARLPTAPEFVIGLVNVRGRIVAVLDLGTVLGHGATPFARGQVVIVDVGGVDVGFAAIECGVARIAKSRLLPVASGESNYFKATDGNDVRVLDVERIIGDTRQTAASLASGAAA